ncbi:acyl-CoA dehydrogenase [Acrocarpospora pleiomorpha]|uniref:Acyl-CoA dehydrogenase n=1 Tax=Acrocarpospora pleiomorpha TaxID=90975 RepID=A0A5M3X879_9ACTN|nr:acyl-CoA dehydrogenase family protein [Acrocarpospora pleiomorpha]GES17314.1 acyl-CoA dehydrogenase [Acrocarpospora pleiomorpha]
MDFTYTDEQLELRAVLRKYLTTHSPESVVRELMEDPRGYDRAQWKDLADQLGLQGLMVPEEYGGLGLGAVELGAVMEELGAHLACLPFLSTSVLATTALLSAGGQAAAAWLPGIVAGEVTATVAVTEGRGAWDTAAVATKAVAVAGGRHRLTGVKTFVLDGHTADLILVAARLDGELRLFAVEADAPGLSRHPCSTMDQTRRFATLEFGGATATPIGGDAEAVLDRVHHVALAALSAEQVGGAQRCLDMAVEYAKTRFQFGRPIGSFQAIKHKCADLLILIEAARAASAFSLWSADADPDGLPLAAAMAKITCSEAFFRAAADTIQIHGGIGFTWEHPAHLYFKRAKSSELLWGDPALHRERISRLLELTV